MFSNFSRPAASVLLAVAFCLATTGNAGAAVNVPGDNTIEKVDFERHMMGLFGRMGCNAGSCHGSFQGKGGFRLSLFGYEPGKDHVALTRDMMGRRINVSDPDQSLLLLKATGQIKHGGGVRFGVDSWQYRVFREWIARGAVHQDGSGEIEKITVSPPEHAFKKAKQSKRLKVTARFKDGSENDITPFCFFRTNDDAVASVSDLGEVSALRAGSTAIIVSYRGQVIPVNVLVPMELPKNFVYPKTPRNNYIDEIVFERLQKLNMAPSELSSDTEFLRRVYLDTIGQLPTPDQVRGFLDDKNPKKRAKLIDRLLEHPLHASLWATKFCDITGNNTLVLEQPNTLRTKRSQMWHDWLRKRFQENAPYDSIVKGILTATSRDEKSVKQWIKTEHNFLQKAVKGYDFDEYANRPSLDLYWRTQRRVPVEQWGEKTAAAFMGVRLECAQCHKHPFDRWSQEEYRAYANVFTQVGFGVSTEGRKEITAFNKNLLKGDKKKRNQVAQLKEVYLLDRPARGLTHPDTNKPLAPRALGGPEINVKKGEDPRVALYEWLSSPDNPFFAKSLVNRVWGHYTGVGVVDPVDDFSLANPPSNEKLLFVLARDFIKHKYDIRHIERVVLNSRAYQLSSKTNATNKLDKRNYSHAYVRPLMAEVVVDALNGALGAEENFGRDIRPGSKAIEVGPSQIQGRIAETFRIFGRPPRTAACDCERAMDPALPQKLYLMTDASLLSKLRANNGRLQKLLKAKKQDNEVLDELFLATLSRFPSETERRTFADHRRKETDSRRAFEDVLWALLNTREFILNH